MRSVIVILLKLFNVYAIYSYPTMTVYLRFIVGYRLPTGAKVPTAMLKCILYSYIFVVIQINDPQHTDTT